MLRIGVVGYGKWGRNLARALTGHVGAAVTAVADLDAGQVAAARDTLSTVELVTTNPADLVASMAVDAVVIATNPGSHFELALAALDAGKHVLVGKPMTTAFRHAERLVDKAEAESLVLMVDHTCVYTESVRLMAELARCELGGVVSYEATRVNLGGFQRDASVLWDLAVHDLSIMDFVLGDAVVEVSATGVASVEGWPEHTVFLSARLASGAHFHAHVSWLAAVKRRVTTLVGDRRMLVYDELREREQVSVADLGVLAPEGQPLSYRRGRQRRYATEGAEPLRAVAIEFIASIAEGRTPLTDGRAGARIIAVLEAAEASLRNGGRPVSVVTSSHG